MTWEPLIQRLRDHLPGLLAIYAFGSRVSGDAGPASDLDMAILAAGKADPVTLWRLAGELADLAGCPVDLVDLRTASTVMQHRIITTGQRLWIGNHRSALYESFILSEKYNGSQKPDSVLSSEPHQNMRSGNGQCSQA
ncbi:MAG: nucleotidyltransferase domain-containing protein, partial [Magnetococcales bacterium]|nr:nucleotidyltransferase domain-containing protein [Magnetococcales bacterium]